MRAARWYHCFHQLLGSHSSNISSRHPSFFQSFITHWHWVSWTGQRGKHDDGIGFIICFDVTLPTQALITPPFSNHSSLLFLGPFGTPVCLDLEGECWEISLTLILYSYFCKCKAFNLPLQLCLIPVRRNWTFALFACRPVSVIDILWLGLKLYIATCALYPLSSSNQHQLTPSLKVRKYNLGNFCRIVLEYSIFREICFPKI